MTKDEMTYFDKQFQDMKENFVKKTDCKDFTHSCYTNNIEPLKKKVDRNVWVLSIFTGIGILLGRYLPQIWKAVF